MLSWGVRIRQTGLIGSEVSPSGGYRDGGKDRCRLLRGLLLFRLVVPPFNQEWWGNIWYGVLGTPVVYRWREPDCI
jgi:hypothetical protein